MCDGKQNKINDSCRKKEKVCATESFESIHTNWHRIGRKCYDEDLEVRHWGFWFLLFLSLLLFLYSPTACWRPTARTSPAISFIQSWPAHSPHKVTSQRKPGKADPAQKTVGLLHWPNLGASSNFLLGRQVQLYLYHIVSVASKYLKLIEYINLEIFRCGLGFKHQAYWALFAHY